MIKHIFCTISSFTPRLIGMSLFASFITFNAQAENCVWQGGPGNWTDPNWSSCTGFPTNNDNAAISSGSVILNQNQSIQQLSFSGGFLNNANTLTVSDLTNWTGGSLRGSGTTQLNSKLTISGDTNKEIGYGQTLNTTATTNWGGNTAINKNQIFLAGSMTINNSSTWNDSNTFDTGMNMAVSGLAKIFNNTGTYNKLGNSTTTLNIQMNNSNTVNVQAGQLNLLGGGTSDGLFNIADGTTLNLNGGFHTWDGVTLAGTGRLLVSGLSSSNTDVVFNNTLVHAGEFELQGNTIAVNGDFTTATFKQSGGLLIGTGTTRVIGEALWTGGSMRSSGTTQMDGNLTITGNNAKELGYGRTLNTNAITNWGGNTAINKNQIFLASSMTINNSGTWNDSNTFDTGMNVSLYGLARQFNNSGTYNKLGDSTTTLNIQMNNTGTVSVQAGQLYLLGGGTSDGLFNIADGTTLNLNGGFHTWDGVTLAGTGRLLVSGLSSSNTDVVFNNTLVHAGEFELQGNTIAVNGNFTTATFKQSGGLLVGTGTTRVTGEALWTGGSMQGAGTTQMDGNLTITGNNAKELGYGRTLNTNAITNWGGNTALNTNRINLTNGMIINNSGTWNDSNAFDTGLNITPFGNQLTFNNSGTYNKLGDSTTTLNLQINNTGRIYVQSGRLSTNTSMINQGVIDVAGGAEFEVKGVAVLTNNNVITGLGTITTSTGIINNAIMSPGNSPGLLTIDGNYTQSDSGTLAIELGGLFAGTQYDVLNITGDATLAGILDVSLFGDFMLADGDSFDILSANSILGEFDQLSFATLGGELDWNIQYLLDDLGTDIVRINITTSAVPVPAAVWLFSSGLLGLIGIARRKAK